MTTTHQLEFLSRPWTVDPHWHDFKVGTCRGLWGVTPDAYEIFAIENTEKHNGHLDDVFQWFEASCRRDGKVLRVIEFTNDRFKRHLIEKRGFTEDKQGDVIKTFT